MQGSMRGVVAALAVTVTLIVAGVAAGASQAASSRSACSDIAWTNKLGRATSYANTSMQYAQSFSWASAKRSMRQAQSVVMSATSPCTSSLRSADRMVRKAIASYILAFTYGQNGQISTSTSLTKTGTSYLNLATQYMKIYNS